MSEPLLQIQNRHGLACGDPPIVKSDDPNVYVGYFENALGEQWIFTYDRKTTKAELRGGDIGWNTAHAIEDAGVGKLVLRPEESAWLHACLKAVMGP